MYTSLYTTVSTFKPSCLIGTTLSSMDNGRDPDVDEAPKQIRSWRESWYMLLSTRKEAIAKLNWACSKGSSSEGTNLDFVRAVSVSDAFVSGERHSRISLTLPSSITYPQSTSRVLVRSPRFKISWKSHRRPRHSQERADGQSVGACRQSSCRQPRGQRSAGNHNTGPGGSLHSRRGGRDMWC